jgi:hypothetical protein
MALYSKHMMSMRLKHKAHAEHALKTIFALNTSKSIVKGKKKSSSPKVPHPDMLE